MSAYAKYFKKDMTKENKVSAAKKVLQILHGENGVTFDRKELSALNDGRLKKLIDKNRQLLQDHEAARARA